MQDLGTSTTAYDDQVRTFLGSGNPLWCLGSYGRAAADLV